MVGVIEGTLLLMWISMVRFGLSITTYFIHPKPSPVFDSL